MRTKEQVKERIKQIETAYSHVLEIGPATLDVNAPRALMQLEALNWLDILYWTIGEPRPKYVCDDRSKLNE